MYIIGTAGHVDHGKSTLVKALTGIDPDRWAEEQRREMTIDLGFAWRVLPSGRTISLVDVPGHERFIKNMLAGVGGIDAALLVIAADESLMPQTEEHLAILDLLGISHGLVVLTKIDLVEPDWLALVRDEVQQRLDVTSLRDAPIVLVSARSGQGLPELLAALDHLLDNTPSRMTANGSPRLSIDRSFTIGGFGTVVTGTLIDGPLRVGDEVAILPKNFVARVRGLQTHQQKQELALPGSRVAVNLAGISHHDLARGDMLALPGVLVPTDKVDVQVRLVRDLVRPLEQNAALEIYVGAAQSLCRATLLDRETLAAGERGWLQLRLAQPLALARGDRFILRMPSPGSTIGGGVILDPHPARHRRFRPEVIARLEALARGNPADLLLPALTDNQPHAWLAVLAASGLDDATAREGMTDLLRRGDVVVLDSGIGQTDSGEALFASPASHLITATGWTALREKLTAALHGYHRRYPLRQGMPREDVRSRLKLAAASFEAVLAAAGDLASANERLVWIHGFQPTLNAAQERELQRLLRFLSATPYSPPAPDIEPELLGLLIEQGKLVRVNEDVVFLAAAYHEMLGWVREQLADPGTVSVAAFRDRFGTSRKYALALLEHLDERRITRRVGDVRAPY